MTRLTTAKLSSCEEKKKNEREQQQSCTPYCFTLKTAPLFAPSARSLLFLFFSLEERVVGRVRLFMHLEKTEKQKK